MNPLILGSMKSMTPEERQFACYIVSGLPKKKSYEQAFPHLCFDFELVDEAGAYKPKLGDKQIQVRCDKLLRRDDVSRYVEFVSQSASNPKLLAEAIVAEQMLTGTNAQRMDAAKLTLNRDEKSANRKTVETYIEVLKEVGAEIIVPVLPGAESARISVFDLIEGRGQVHFPKAAKIRLLEMAGFPFNSSIDMRTGIEEKWPMSPLQMEYLGRHERFLYLHGGSGLGKSVLGGAFAFLHLMTAGHKAAVVGATYDLASNEYDYVYKAFINLFGRDGAVRCVNMNTHHNHDMEILTLWNSHCTAYSLGNEEGVQVLGKEFDIIVVGEGSHVPIDYWETKCLRALDRRIGMYGHLYETGRGVCFTTPKGFEGMSSAEFDRVEKITNGRPEMLHVGGVLPDGRHVNWHETVYLRSANVLENPSYSRPVFEARRRSLTKEAFEEQYEGKRTSRSGLVVKEYDKDRHRIEMPHPKMISQMRLGVGIDTGKYFAATLWGVHADGVTRGLGEVYLEESTIAEACFAIREMVCDVLAAAWGFPLPGSEADITATSEKMFDKIDLWRVDPASQHKEDIVDILGIPLGAEKIELLPSLDDLRELFKNDQLFISDTMERLHLELTKYRWIRRKDASAQYRSGAQLPERANDHAIDSARFVVGELRKSGPAEIEPLGMTFEENFDAQRRHEIVGRFYQHDDAMTTTNMAGQYHDLHGGS